MTILGMKLPSTIRFADDKIKQMFEELAHGDDAERKRHKNIHRAFTEISANAFCGVQIPKRLIPREYLAQQDVKNLWKYNLPEAWRLLYSIESDGIIVLSIILDWLDHETYERKFKY